MTINGGDGNDSFIVFHNLAVLDLNGDDGDDTFLVGRSRSPARRTTAARSPTERRRRRRPDPVRRQRAREHRRRRRLRHVIVIGTEFADDFVITKDGVFGAGLNVNFVNIEKLDVDGAEGDDRFFVLCTGINFKTRSPAASAPT